MFDYENMLHENLNIDKQKKIERLYHECKKSSDYFKIKLIIFPKIYQD